MPNTDYSVTIQAKNSEGYSQSSTIAITTTEMPMMLGSMRGSPALPPTTTSTYNVPEEPVPVQQTVEEQGNGKTAAVVVVLLLLILIVSSIGVGYYYIQKRNKAKQTEENVSEPKVHCDADFFEEDATAQRQQKYQTDKKLISNLNVHGASSEEQPATDLENR